MVKIVNQTPSMPTCLVYTLLIVLSTFYLPCLSNNETSSHACTRLLATYNTTCYSKRCSSTSERKRCKTDVQAILRTVLVFQTPIMTSLLHKQTNARYLRT